MGLVDDYSAEPDCRDPEGHDWCLPAALGFSDPRPVNRNGTSVTTHLCKHDCGRQRITEVKENGARKVYYLVGDLLFP
jgi:hypothetical protein